MAARACAAALAAAVFLAAGGAGGPARPAADPAAPKDPPKAIARLDDVESSPFSKGRVAPAPADASWKDVAVLGLLAAPAWPGNPAGASEPWCCSAGVQESGFRPATPAIRDELLRLAKEMGRGAALFHGRIQRRTETTVGPGLPPDHPGPVVTVTTYRMTIERVEEIAPEKAGEMARALIRDPAALGTYLKSVGPPIRAGRTFYFVQGMGARMRQVRWNSPEEKLALRVDADVYNGTAAPATIHGAVTAAILGGDKPVPLQPEFNDDPNGDALQIGPETERDGAWVWLLPPETAGKTARVELVFRGAGGEETKRVEEVAIPAK